MFDRLMALFSGAEDAQIETSGTQARKRLELAAAALLVLAARLDGVFDEDEQKAIHTELCSRFELTTEQADELIDEARATVDDSVELYGFTKVIKDQLEPEERVSIVEMLWEVIYADGDVHHLEANLVRRVAGLLYVPDRDSGAARKRVLARLKKDPHIRS